jgi:ABC-2 type transport system permease protein
MIPALVTEWSKLARATLVRTTTALLVIGIALMCSSMLLAVNTTDAGLAAKLGPLIDPGGWEGYLATAAQVTAAAALLGFGVVLSWMFGREFTDGTITGLFALPIRRSTIALAKLTVYAVWCAGSSVALLAALLLAGVIFGLGPIPLDLVPAAARQVGLAVLTGAIAVPVAWVATLARSIITGIGAVIGILVAAQVAVISGAGGWFTLSAPGLWAASGGADVSGIQLLLVLPLAALAIVLTTVSWQRLELDR